LNQAGGRRTWDLSIDTERPIDGRGLRVEVETGTTLTPTGELDVLAAAEWNRT
jgi:hypothetical protein